MLCCNMKPPVLRHSMLAMYALVSVDGEARSCRRVIQPAALNLMMLAILKLRNLSWDQCSAAWSVESLQGSICWQLSNPDLTAQCHFDGSWSDKLRCYSFWLTCRRAVARRSCGSSLHGSISPLMHNCQRLWQSRGNNTSSHRRRSCW